MIVPVSVFVSMGRPLRRGGLWTMRVRRCIWVHGIGNAGSDALYEQMPGCAFDMRKAFHTQHWLLFGNLLQSFSQSVSVLVLITPQDKREPPRIFHV
jgi:hypothetical protein